LHSGSVFIGTGLLNPSFVGKFKPRRIVERINTLYNFYPFEASGIESWALGWTTFGFLK
jgi:hypothetical protein